MLAGHLKTRKSSLTSVLCSICFLSWQRGDTIFNSALFIFPAAWVGCYEGWCLGHVLNREKLMLFTLLISLNACMVEFKHILSVQAYHDACFALHSPKIHVQIKGACVCPALGIKETTDTNLRSLNAIFSSVSQRKPGSQVGWANRDCTENSHQSWLLLLSFLISITCQWGLAAMPNSSL